MIKFIEPTFNEFTLNFPPESYMHPAERVHRQTLDLMHEIFAEGKVVRDVKTRAERRTRKRLESLVGGGWIVEFAPRQHRMEPYAPSRQQRKAALRDAAANLLHAPVESVLE